MTRSPSKLNTTELEDQIRSLEEEVYLLRSNMIGLAPPELETVLGRHRSVHSWEELDQFQERAVEAAVGIAVAVDNGFEKRADCPICRSSGSSPYVKGFKLPTGLEMHLKGEGSARHCVVMKAALELARQSCSRSG